MTFRIERYPPALPLFFAHLNSSFLHEFLAQRNKPIVLTIGLEHAYRLFEIRNVCVGCTICSTHGVVFLRSCLNTASTSLLFRFDCTWIIIRVRLCKEFLARVAPQLYCRIIKGLVIHTDRFVRNKSMH